MIEADSKKPTSKSQQMASWVDINLMASVTRYVQDYILPFAQMTASCSFLGWQPRNKIRMYTVGSSYRDGIFEVDSKQPASKS